MYRLEKPRTPKSFFTTIFISKRVRKYDIDASKNIVVSACDFFLTFWKINLKINEYP